MHHVGQDWNADAVRVVHKVRGDSHERRAEGKDERDPTEPLVLVAQREATDHHARNHDSGDHG